MTRIDCIAKSPGNCSTNVNVIIAAVVAAATVVCWKFFNPVGRLGRLPLVPILLIFAKDFPHVECCLSLRSLVAVYDMICFINGYVSLCASIINNTFNYITFAFISLVDGINSAWYL